MFLKVSIAHLSFLCTLFRQLFPLFQSLKIFLRVCAADSSSFAAEKPFNIVLITAICRKKAPAWKSDFDIHNRTRKPFRPTFKFSKWNKKWTFSIQKRNKFPNNLRTKSITQTRIKPTHITVWRIKLTHSSYTVLTPVCVPSASLMVRRITIDPIRTMCHGGR